MRTTSIWSAFVPAALVALVAMAVSDGAAERRQAEARRALDRHLAEIHVGIETEDNRRRNVGKRELVAYVATLTAAEVPVLESVLAEEPYLECRVLLMESFGLIDCAEAADAIRRRVEYLAQLAPAMNVAEVLRGGLALSVMTDPRAFEILATWIEARDDLRPIALVAVTNKPQLFDRLELVTPYLGDPDTEIRKRAAGSLHSGEDRPLAGRRRAAEALVAQLAVETEMRPLQAQLSSLRSLRVVGTEPAIAAKLSHPQMKIRQWSVEALAAIGSPEAIRILAEHLTTETSARVRAKCLEAVGDGEV